MNKSKIIAISIVAAVGLSGCTTASSTRGDNNYTGPAQSQTGTRKTFKFPEFKFPKFEFPKRRTASDEGKPVKRVSLFKPGKPIFRQPHPSDEFIDDYRQVTDGEFVLPEIPVDKINKEYLRQRVSYATREKPGTIVVDVPNRFLYLVEPNGQAIRYGVGVGRQGFEWSGDAYVAWKQAWPKWTPPAEMIARKPELEKYSEENGGMEPGLLNPLGARALYLFQNGEDTLYRLHGTPEWQSIGTAASSGCIRLMNQDIMDLYSRVKGRPKVVVKQS